MTDNKSGGGANTRRAVAGARKHTPGWVRPVAGLLTVLAILGILALAIGLFRASFTKTVPLTVLSPRAGLVMNPDARVKMRGVQVGKVVSIENRPDGSAALHLAMDPDQMHLIPANVTANIASSTVFGSKFVELVSPSAPSANALQPGQVVDTEHVTVEINTVFEQLVNVLDKIDPAKLNETLGAISKAFNGRGEKIGQTLSDFDHLLAKLDPSLPTLEHEMEGLPAVAGAYADAAPNLMTAADNAVSISNTLVSEQTALDAALVNVIGLADVGNEVLGGNRQALADVTHLLVPTTELLDRYNDHLRCAIGGIAPFAKTPPLPDPGVLVSFNSDSSELARRLYLEAAKAVKYGGTPDIEALKFVTLNPAKQLHIDSRVGSLEPGKDADFAIWSGSPLDSHSVCLQTWIDGKKYFDRSLSAGRAAALVKEREELMAKAKQLAKLAGGGGDDGGGGGEDGRAFFRVALEHQFDGVDRDCLDEEGAR